MVVNKTKHSNKFRRMFRRVPGALQEEFKEFVKELLAGEVGRHRRMHKMQGYSNPEIYEARLNHSDRVTFTINDDVALFRTIGAHDTAYGNL